MGVTKNLTVSLAEDETADLDFLVEYYQRRSISTVTKSDVVKFMIRQTRKSIEAKIKENESSTNNNDIDV